MNGGTRSARFESRSASRRERDHSCRPESVRSKSRFVGPKDARGRLNLFRRNTRARVPNDLERQPPHIRRRARHAVDPTDASVFVDAAPRPEASRQPRRLRAHPDGRRRAPSRFDFFESFVNGSKRASRSRSARHDGGQSVRGEGRGEPVRRARRARRRERGRRLPQPLRAARRAFARGERARWRERVRVRARAHLDVRRVRYRRVRGLERRVRRASGVRRTLGVQRASPPHPVSPERERPRVTSRNLTSSSVIVSRFHARAKIFCVHVFFSGRGGPARPAPFAPFHSPSLTSIADLNR